MKKPCFKTITVTSFSSDTINNFKDKIMPAIDGCWYWTGTVNNRGYGMVQIENKKFLAHRISFALNKSKLRNNALICHTCDNRLCVNPDHLYSGTYLSNMIDKNKKGRGNMRKGSDVWKAKLTEDDVLKIRDQIKSGVMQGSIASAFNISQCSVSSIKHRRSWKHI